MDQPNLQQLLSYGLASLAFVYLLNYIGRPSGPNLDHIPTVGPSSYLGVLRFIRQTQKLTQDGYEKHRNGLFKMATIDRWIVICCGQQYVEDLRKASDVELSLWRALSQLAALKYNFSEGFVEDPYHVQVIRTALNRNLAVCFPNIYDELVQSFEDVLGLDDDEWKAVPAMNTTLRIVCQISNRTFVGLPLCRDPDYLQLSMQFTNDVTKTAIAVNLAPAFLRPIVGKYASKLPAYVKRMSKYISPIIKERLQNEAKYGKDWPGKPNDAITWLLEEAQGERRTVYNLILRLLATNFTAMHTSSMAFTHALYHLAASPEYAASLREEVLSIVKEDGWTKTAVDRMSKVDNFFRESQRVNGVGSLTLVRLAMKDFVFSDGTVLPAGTLLSVPLYATHHDELRYSNPHVFDPSRFAASKECDGDGPKLQLVTPSLDYVPWGLGKHACPGRFFAATELKTMLAHVVVSYDVKLLEDGRPQNEWFATNCVPNRTAKVLFRKRRM